MSFPFLHPTVLHCMEKCLILLQNKARAHPSEEVLHSRVGSWPYLQTLDKAGKVCQGQTHKLITKNCQLRTKKSYNIGLRWVSPTTSISFGHRFFTIHPTANFGSQTAASTSSTPMQTFSKLHPRLTSQLSNPGTHRHLTSSLSAPISGLRGSVGSLSTSRRRERQTIFSTARTSYTTALLSSPISKRRVVAGPETYGSVRSVMFVLDGTFYQVYLDFSANVN